MVNKYRGELEISLKGKKYKTKLSLDSIVRIETALGKSILEVANDLMNSRMKMTDVITILTQAIRGGGNDLTEKEIGRIVFDIGIVESFKVVGEILTNTITGGENDDIEKKEETESSQPN